MSRIDNQQLEAAIAVLLEAGISDLVGYFPDEGGSRTFIVDINEVGRFLADPVAHKAASVGVSAAKFLAWQRFASEDWQCRGRTRNGTRCRTSLRCSAQEFAEGITDHCFQHRGYR